MATPLIRLQQRSKDSWLIGVDSQQLTEQAIERSQQLTHLLQQGILPRILIVESDPTRLLAGFIAACSAQCPVFLGNPQWAAVEWQQVWQLVQPHVFWGDALAGEATSHCPPFPVQNYLERQLSHPTNEKGWIMIPTGGSSGVIRFAIHTWHTLMASVQGFQQHFEVEQVHSCCVLPLHHVSGLMQFLRSFTSGGQFVTLPFKDLKSGLKPQLQSSHGFLSLVPTQLQQLLQTPDLADWLTQFQTVLLGGAPASDRLLNMARQRGIPLAPTYGMTETASQVATLTPQKFLQGHTSLGNILPHAQIMILDANHQILPANHVGKVVIQAASLALGYYPTLLDLTPYFETDDVGFLDDRGELNIVGRNSEKIITGGENVFPPEVESAILATGLVTDVCVVGLPDAHWGEVVTAIYVPQHPEIHSLEIQAEMANKISRFKCPKKWVAVTEIPRNSQGKINRQQLKLAYV
ncbi:MAG: 2-succinylbenzoate--CoA ligase [Oculatellaceae cyanobacterium bins.114]|nr:2-succinylbenzoate--CoA ligase [Oculatellaceae cyanobacterium bins.114]